LIKKIKLIYIFIIIFHLKVYGAGAICENFEAINLWPQKLKSGTTLNVEICCNKNNVPMQSFQYSRTLQLQLELGDAIQISDLDKDHDHASYYLCNIENKELYNKCIDFPSAFVNRDVDSMPVRIYHQETIDLMKPGGNPPYYGFRVVEGKVGIVGADKVRPICAAKKVGTKKIQEAKSKLRPLEKNPENSNIRVVESASGQSS